MISLTLCQLAALHVRLSRSAKTRCDLESGGETVRKKVQITLHQHVLSSAL